ncbi:MAG: threonine synthase, partial [Gammaproteobacteria bacterium]|nr:threonine synthase [Gammaproteobacteria bacterium]
MSSVGFVSSRGSTPAVTLTEAIRQGLAPDGGLYVPTRLPSVDVASFAGLVSLPEIARSSLSGFFEGDRLQSQLEQIADTALNFDAPTTPVIAAKDRLFALELFHGPTAAFKDFGARFLAETLQRLEAGASQPLTILVATSGDTGGAVAAAFHLRPWVRIVILYPKGLVSPRQEQQLTCWGDNVISLRIDGSFDDCQRLVKEAFVDFALSQKHRFSSANSINIGRLLPQMVYYVASSLDVERRTGAKASYIIPAGNLGNAFAAVWARALGFPIGRIILAHNANRTVPDYLTSGVWQPRSSIPTLASAMDVGNPSNMERIRALYPALDSIREQLSAVSIDDATIRTRIGEDFMHYGREWCPHTATAAEVYSRL